MAGVQDEKRERKKIINQLTDQEGNICYQNEEKKKIVENYYKELYQQETVAEETIKQYFKKAEKCKKALEERITMMEVMEAIKRQKKGKTLGPDGLPAEFYKTMQDVLSNVMLEVFNELLLKAKIPDSWSEAYITLIPKEESDLQQMKNYRPISLLNVDYKIFASIMAERLKRLLSEFIYSDQNGFLPKRQIRDNMWIILNALEYYEAHSEKQMALLFLDVQKVFDNVNWQFMTMQLQMMDFGRDL